MADFPTFPWHPYTPILLVGFIEKKAIFGRIPTYSIIFPHPTAIIQMTRHFSGRYWLPGDDAYLANLVHDLFDFW